MNSENSISINFEELNQKIFKLYDQKKSFISKLESLLKDVIDNVTES